MNLMEFLACFERIRDADELTADERHRPLTMVGQEFAGRVQHPEHFAIVERLTREGLEEVASTLPALAPPATLQG